MTDADYDAEVRFAGAGVLRMETPPLLSSWHPAQLDAEDERFPDMAKLISAMELRISRLEHTIGCSEKGTDDART